MIAYTDYSFKELGDVPYRKAPIRECNIQHWDGNKYGTIEIAGLTLEVKVGYLYLTPKLLENVPTEDLVEVN